MDVAWLMTHLAWQERARWPSILGQVTEYKLWAALGQPYTTLAMNALYVQVEQALGADEAAGTCADVELSRI